eukprot:CAMPEP_0185023290 /NCGR_PEP_ID=MMETSP1103-20130426/5979_1 /TAXON_ID=36769 /ORGANISM="Paraphysomonas bandaiensis, Strain Caron Lab Isolate" /LENGTH=240 /DNA_ID=CAMNT_0027555821 /DNA_START=157 /DNA_END=876 /DNA_ORIENTATION=+
MAARDETRGSNAVQEVLRNNSSWDVSFRQLDISDSDSIDAFVRGIEQDFDKCDVLVNNAGIAFKGADPTPFAEQARPTVHTNYFGTLSLTQKMLPLLRKGEAARVVNVASSTGHLKIIKDENKRAAFSSNDLTIDQLNNMMETFVSDVESGCHRDNNWPDTCYGMSKLGVIAMTKVLAREEAPRVAINACCPGYCDTDMTSHKGPRTAEHGARTPALLALMNSDPLPTGKFFYDEEETAW